MRRIRASPERPSGGFSRFRKRILVPQFLSDENKRAMYDAGLYDPFEEEDEEFCDFMQEMLGMMNNVKDKGDSLEDLQRMFVEMVGGDCSSFDSSTKSTDKKRPCVTTSRGNSGKRNGSRF